MLKTEIMNNILTKIAGHRLEQETRYGHVNHLHSDGTGPDLQWLKPYTDDDAWSIESKLRTDYEAADQGGVTTWMHLVREEIAEAFKETDQANLEIELLQAAALIVSWLEHLHYRSERALSNGGR